jgi:hypothetical protein
MPVSCETSLSEKILPEKDSPGVRGGSIEDGVAKKMSGLESELSLRRTIDAIGSMAFVMG